MSMDDEETRLPPGVEAGASLGEGQDFDEYRVVRLLGRGGMGEVYEVEHRVLRSRHALKLINQEIAGRPDARARFEREAETMCRLRHPHIVHVDDFRQSHGRAWLRMELIGKLESGKVGTSEGVGSSLADKLKAEGGKLPEAGAHEILRQVLEGLAYAHGQGVVHRDLKPANVLLEQGAGSMGQGAGSRGHGAESGEPPALRALIADFGLVKLAGEQWVHSQVQKSVARSMSMSDQETVGLGMEEAKGSGSGGTSTKALLGTYAYMSPEQKKGVEADARSDVYAVGLMAYQMLTGAEGLGMRRPSELVEGLSSDWDSWILRACETNQADRFADAGEMLAALPERRALAADRRGEIEGVGSKRSAAKARGAFRWVIAAVLLLAVGAGWFQLRMQNEELRSADSPQPTTITQQPTPAQQPSTETTALDPTPAHQQPTTINPQPSVLLRIDPADAGARVWLGAEADVAVGADGTLRFEDFPLGEHELLVQAPGYQPVVTRVEVGAAGLEETVRLVAVRGSVEVRLQNEELRRGAGVVVRVDGREQSGAWRDGVLRLEGLEVGRRSVEVSHPSYRTDQTDLTVTDQRTIPHEVRLEPLPGRITLAVSGPRAGEWSVEVGGEAMRPASGNVLELAAQREHVVRVSARGWQAAEQRVRLGAAEQRRLSFRMEEARGPVPGQNAEVELPGGVKVELVWIRPGEFRMGSPGNEAGRFNDEGPQTSVRLTRGFWLGKYPVTQGQWQALMGNNPSHFKQSGLNAPVEQVSWTEAMEFARRLTERERAAGRLPEGYVYTLPSEAQWEYACRAGTTTRFNLGNSDSDLGRAGWFRGNAQGRTHAVGQKTPNAWGLYDMHGNVFEWTRSWFGNYPGGSVVDYEGPSSGSGRVSRGGSWLNNARVCRSANRYDWGPELRNVGFRLALSSVP
jgi:formylglycine-generating enzyme required for sulfatase activity/serine/threonine protein kinase